MLWECRDRFPRHRLQPKPLVSDPGMHHGTCVTHMPWCISGSLTRGDGKNVPGIPGACTTRNCTYLARGPFHIYGTAGPLWGESTWTPPDLLPQYVNHIVGDYTITWSNISPRGFLGEHFNIKKTSYHMNSQSIECARSVFIVSDSLLPF